jgi:hypothetical protein
MEEVMPTNTVAPPPIDKIKVRVDMELIGKSWDFNLVADDPASGPYVKPGNRIEVPNGPQTKIEFKLQGSAAGKLDFNESDPIWVQENQCPTSQCSDPDVRITDINKNKLEINDLNTKATELHYRLNFVDRAGGEYEWDPIIRNGGGGP